MKKTSLPKAIAITAFWMIAVPTLVIIRALGGEKEPNVATVAEK